MRLRRKFSALATVVALPTILVGCSSNRRTPDVKPLRVEVRPSPQVTLPPPSVRWDGHALRVAGEVRRAPSFDGTVAGHVHVDLVSSGGELLDQVLLGWTPHDIGQGERGQSKYQVTYVPESLPPDTVVRVAVVDDEQEHLFPGPESSGGGVGGSAGVSHSGTPKPLGTPQTGKRSGAPRQPRQKSSTPRTPSGRRR